MLPSVSMLKTRIGSLLSIHSEIAVESMTCSPRLKHVDVGEFVELDRVRVGLGIGVVDAVDLGRLHDAFGVDLEGAQCRCGVRGEVRVAGACREDDDALLLEVSNRTTSDVGLGDRLHVDGAHHAGEDAVALERLLQRQRVHDRGEHADVVGLRAVHAFRGRRDAPEDVAAAHDDRDLDVMVSGDADLLGQGIEDLGVDTVAGVTHQGFT